MDVRNNKIRACKEVIIAETNRRNENVKGYNFQDLKMSQNKEREIMIHRYFSLH